MAIAIFLRVGNRGPPYADQVADLEAWAASQGGGEVLCCFGAPGLEQMLTAARRGLVTKVGVVSLDRFGLTLGPLVTLLNELRVLDVGVVSLDEGISFTTPVGWQSLEALASLAAADAAVRKERQAVGIARARAKGTLCGGRKPGARNRRTIKREQQIRQLVLKGFTTKEILERVKAPRRAVSKVKQEVRAQEPLDLVIIEALLQRASKKSISKPAS